MESLPRAPPGKPLAAEYLLDAANTALYLTSSRLVQVKEEKPRSLSEQSSHNSIYSFMNQIDSYCVPAMYLEQGKQQIFQ